MFDEGALILYALHLNDCLNFGHRSSIAEAMIYNTLEIVVDRSAFPILTLSFCQPFYIGLINRIKDNVLRSFYAARLLFCA